MTRIIILIVIWWICFIWFVWWKAYTENRIYNNAIEIEKKEQEIEWWKTQTHEVLKEVNEWKDKYADMQHEKNKLRNECFELKQKLDAYIKWYEWKRPTIAQTKEEEIKYWFNKWLSNKQIWEKVWCSKATIQRATKELWLR